MHSSETWPILLLASAGKILLVLPPLVAEGILPVNVGLDPIAVADVHGGLAFEPVNGAMHRFDTPAGDVIHEHIESRLVELNNINAVFLECPRFLVQQAGESHRHLHLVAVIGVSDRVGDRHRAGQGDLQLAVGVRARVPRFGLVYASLQFKFTAHDRHHRFVAVGADSHLDFVREVDSVDIFEKAMHEMLARHLAVANDVDTGVLLPFDCEQCGIELGGGELLALQPPLRPQLVRFGEPGGFWQAAGDGRRKQHVYAVSKRCGGRQL